MRGDGDPVRVRNVDVPVDESVGIFAPSWKFYVPTWILPSFPRHDNLELMRTIQLRSFCIIGVDLGEKVHLGF